MGAERSIGMVSPSVHSYDDGSCPSLDASPPAVSSPPKELPALPFAGGPLAVMVDGGCRCAGLPCRRGAASGPSSRRASPRWGGGGAVRYGSVALSDGSGGGADTCLRTPGPGPRARAVDDQRSTLKRLLVEASDGFLRLRGVVEFDKGHPPGPPAIPIRRTDADVSSCRQVIESVGEAPGAAVTPVNAAPCGHNLCRSGLSLPCGAWASACGASRGHRPLYPPLPPPPPPGRRSVRLPPSRGRA